MEETKKADPSLIDAENVMEMANPHGDMGHGGNVQAIVQTQCNDWDANVLNYVLVQVLVKHMMDTNATDDFTLFLMHQGLDITLVHCDCEPRRFQVCQF